MNERPKHRKSNITHTWIRSSVGYFCAVCKCVKTTLKGKVSFEHKGITSTINPDCTKIEHMLNYIKAGNKTIADYMNYERNHLFEYVIKSKSYAPEGMKFHSKIEWIWPVAKQLYDELRQIPEKVLNICWIESNTNLMPWLGLCTANMAFDVERLFLETVNAINQLTIFRNRIKEPNPERSVATEAK